MAYDIRHHPDHSRPAARLDRLPASPLTLELCNEPRHWATSRYETGDKVRSGYRDNWAYALPIKPAEPWSLPAPPAGKAWHRLDGWTAEMLPEGWRPMLLNETGDCEYLYNGEWKPLPNRSSTSSHANHCRTRRPLPASQPEQADNIREEDRFPNYLDPERRKALQKELKVWIDKVKAERASQAEVMPPLALVTFEDGRKKHITNVEEVRGATLIRIDWGKYPTEKERQILHACLKPASPAKEIPAPTMAPPKILWISEVGMFGTNPKGEAGKAKAPLAEANPVQDMALGGQMYWRDLARQLAEVWWKCHNIGASLQHGDIDTDVSFSVVCERHGGRVFHADTPHNAWLKAEKWLMSPDRENFPSANLDSPACQFPGTAQSDIWEYITSPTGFDDWDEYLRKDGEWRPYNEMDMDCTMPMQVRRRKA